MTGPENTLLGCQPITQVVTAWLHHVDVAAPGADAGMAIETVVLTISGMTVPSQGAFPPFAPVSPI